ncbi:mitochondrial substrate carrier family protein [Tieghemostelium lacteum]|uniref:Mitochondrial substrate carrier family protein n=1 Tax=Tieghemostelium lacteum TaxID=361077 RepID=A0A151ZJE1_TIELA|nr:mitochondrial substrate carrier family protein [Tieghemostelium lacteum]|eukprot:KYQ94112.1 mitochondrial substrate carrier family protein [Tieghemostelium lacteum]
MQLQGELGESIQKLASTPSTTVTDVGVSKAIKPEKGTLNMLNHIHKTEGLFTLYRGLSASLLRQATYTTTRFGLYGLIKDILVKDNKSFPFYKKVLVGMISGAGGAIIGTPADVIMVRMQADGKLPLEQRRNYKNAFDGILRISKEEGILSLWKGCSPNVIRAMFMTAGQVSSYDQAKQMMITSGYFQDNIKTHLIASTISAFVASLVTSPLDVVKTRIMNTKSSSSSPSPAGTTSNQSAIVYKGTLDCFTKTFKSEGVAAFYKGFGPYFLRLGPQTILTFIFVEQLSNLWRKTSNYFK